jgi:hypothetical protein
MKPSYQILRTLTLAIALGISHQAMSAGYMKFDDIKGESTESAAQPSRTDKPNATPQPINGGLDRDIIRRVGKGGKGSSTSTTPRAPVLNTNPVHNQGIEPDEID